MIPFGKETKKNAFFRRLRELAEAQPYLSFDRIQSTAKGDKLIESEATLKDYLSEAVDKGILHDAGRGWYSGMLQPLPLDTQPIEPLSKLLTKKFPLLPVCCWSTAQLNPYLEHLLGKSIHFVFTETDALRSVAEYLRGEGFQVAENPRGETQKRLSLDDNLVILRPGTLWQDYTDGPHAPWEVLFVQAWQEVDRLGFIDRAEYQAAVGRALERGYIQIASLIAYARKAKIPLMDTLKGYQLAENI